MIVRYMKEVWAVRRKWLVMAAVLLAADIACYLYGTSHQKVRLAALQKEWFEMRKAQEKGQQLNIASLYQKGAADLATWNSLIPEKKDFARLVGELFEAAANNSLTVGSVGYKTSQMKDEKVVVYDVAFDVAGKYAAVKSFLVDVLRSREMIVLENISLNSGKEMDDTVSMKVQLRILLRVAG